jgi:hypothetical protein
MFAYIAIIILVICLVIYLIRSNKSVNGTWITINEPILFTLVINDDGSNDISFSFSVLGIKREGVLNVSQRHPRFVATGGVNITNASFSVQSNYDTLNVYEGQKIFVFKRL